MPSRRWIPAASTALLPVAALVVLLLARDGAFVSRDSAPLIIAIVIPVVGVVGLLGVRGQGFGLRLGLVLLASFLGVASVWAHRDLLRERRLAREEAGKRVLLDEAAPPIDFAQTLHLEPEQQKLLETMQGRWLLLDFWATWCSPCLRQMPKLGELQVRHPDDLLVVGVIRLEGAAENHPRELEKIRRFVERVGVGYPILIVEGTDVWRAYRIAALPTSVLVDVAGRVVDYGIGIDGTDRVLRAAEQRLTE